MDLVSLIFIIFSAAIIPLIAYPRLVAGIVVTSYQIDHTGYYKMVFFNITAIFMAVVMVINYRISRNKFSLNIPLLFFTLWVGVSTIFSENLIIAVLGHPTRWQGLITYISYFILFTFTLNMLNPQYTKKILKFIFISALIISVYSIVNYYGYDPMNLLLKAFWETTLNADISRATLGNRNTAGAYFSLLLPVSIHLFLVCNNKKNSILLFISTTMFFSGMVVSLTRVSWIGTTMVCFVFLWLLRKNIKKYIKKLGIIIVTFIIVTILLDYTGGGKIVGRYFDFRDQVKVVQENSNYGYLGSNRVFAYKRALVAIKDHPLVGIGPECFVYYGRMTLEESKELLLPRRAFYDKVHSDYLEFAATMGIPSLIFYLWFLFSIFIPLLRRKDNIPPEILAVFAGWTAYIVQAAFNFNTISVSPVFFVLSAILYNFLISEKKDSSSESGNLTSSDDGNVDKIALT